LLHLWAAAKARLSRLRFYAWSAHFLKKAFRSFLHGFHIFEWEWR
jgi:hypothetical protein